MPGRSPARGSQYGPIPVEKISGPVASRSAPATTGSGIPPTRSRASSPAAAPTDAPTSSASCTHSPGTATSPRRSSTAARQGADRGGDALRSSAARRRTTPRPDLGVGACAPLLGRALGRAASRSARRRRTGRSRRGGAPRRAIRSCATRCTSSAVTSSSSASISSGSSASPSSTSRRRPNMIRPCGLSSWSTKRPLANARAFSSSSAGTGSAAICCSSLDDRRDRLVDAVDVDARLRVERAGVGVAVVDAVDVVGEAAALAHLDEEPRRHAAAEHGREQLQRVAVGMLERVGSARRGRGAPGRTSFVWTRDAAVAVRRAAAPGSARPSSPAMSPSSSSSVASRSSPTLPPTPTTMRVGRVPVVEVVEERVARRAAGSSPCVPRISQPSGLSPKISSS